jgi:hypothetical protein
MIDWDDAWAAMADGEPEPQTPDPDATSAHAVNARLPEPPLWGPLVIDNEAEFLAAHGEEALEDARLVAMDEGW